MIIPVLDRRKANFVFCLFWLVASVGPLLALWFDCGQKPDDWFYYATHYPHFYLFNLALLPFVLKALVAPLRRYLEYVAEERSLRSALPLAMMILGTIGSFCIEFNSKYEAEWSIKLSSTDQIRAAEYQHPFYLKLREKLGFADIANVSWAKTTNWPCLLQCLEDVSSWIGDDRLMALLTPEEQL